MSSVETIIQSIYVVAAVLFIVGLKRMSSPTTARTGIIWAGVGMLMATVATFFYPGIENFLLIATAIFLGTVIAFGSDNICRAFGSDDICRAFRSSNV